MLDPLSVHVDGFGGNLQPKYDDNGIVYAEAQQESEDDEEGGKFTFERVK